MRRIVDFFLFWLKVVALVFGLSSVIAFFLLLLSGGLTLFERFIYAIYSGIANGLVFGTIIALYMSWKTWRVIRANQQKLARKSISRLPSKTKKEAS